MTAYGLEMTLVRLQQEYINSFKINITESHTANSVNIYQKTVVFNVVVDFVLFPTT